MTMRIEVRVDKTRTSVINFSLSSKALADPCMAIESYGKRQASK